MARISEIHYSNNHANNTGVGEFFEVALSPGEDPADFFVSTYNQDGSVFLDISLTDAGVTSSIDPGSGETIYVISGAVYGFVLTDPDGNGTTNNEAVALTDVSGASNVVVDFYDVGGGTTNILATNGSAAGATSTNLAGDFGFSIQFNQPNPGTPVFETTSPGTADAVCFVAGTPILTNRGYLPVEDLKQGDLVQTMDNGYQPLRWVGSQTVSGMGRHAPYRISKGHLGAQSDIWVSPAHRLFVSNWRSDLFFGEHEILASANALKGHDGVSRNPQKTVTYLHLLFDKHEVVFSNGLASESFFPRPRAMSSLDFEAQAEVLDLFPELSVGFSCYGDSARRILRGFEAAAFSLGGGP